MALADEISRYRLMGDQKVYSGEHVANILEHWSDRLAATPKAGSESSSTVRAGMREALEAELTECESALATIEAHRTDNQTQWGNERFYQGKASGLRYALERLAALSSQPVVRVDQKETHRTMPESQQNI